MSETEGPDPRDDGSDERLADDDAGIDIDDGAEARGGRQKRALSSLRPPTTSDGDARVSGVLFEALSRAASEPADTLTHGFHAWPARMHPSIASAILDARGRSGRSGRSGSGERSASSASSASSGRSGNTAQAHVVDPFCGGGTVLIEARRRGLRSTGVDLNPVALRVAEVKTDVRDEASRNAFAKRLDDVVEKSKARVRAKSGDARAPLTPQQARRFDGHVLKELAGLHAEILAVDNERDRRALLVVLSAIVIKVSRQRSETDARGRGDAATGGGAGGARRASRIGRFITSEIFQKKGHELVERWAALASASTSTSLTLQPQLFHDDARRLPDVLRRHTARADIILTSPPYGGTYDYAEHHALRAPWLRVDLKKLEAGEIGARRRVDARGWDDEMLAVLKAMSSSMSDDGTAVLVVGDGELGERNERRRIDALDQLHRLSSSASMRVLASASAPRTDWRGGPDRMEHVVALVLD